MGFPCDKIAPSSPRMSLSSIFYSRGSRPSRTLPVFSTVWKPIPEWKGLWRGTLMCRAKRLADEERLFRRERLAWGWTNEPRETTDDVKRLADEGSPFRNGRGFDVGRMQLLKYVAAISNEQSKQIAPLSGAICDKTGTKLCCPLRKILNRFPIQNRCDQARQQVLQDAILRGSKCHLALPRRS